MSLFGSLMSGFDDDPFFGGARGLMRQMNTMMNTMMRDSFVEDPFFGDMGGAVGADMGVGGGFPALLAPPGTVATQSAAPRAPARFRHRDPFQSILSSLQDGMVRQGTCHTFSSSSVMTMTTGPDGKPQVYQASSTSQGAPGGVQETRRTVSDSRTGTKRMAIGHHIGERAHIIERESNLKGDMEERQEFINLEEDDARDFDHEFRRRVQPYSQGSVEYRSRHHRTPSAPTYTSRGALPAITSSSYSRRRSRPTLAITAGPSGEDRARRRDREERGHRFNRRYETNM